MSKLIIKTLWKKLIWVANLKFGRTHPVLEELLILGVIRRRSNRTIETTVPSGSELQPLIGAGAAKLAWIPQEMCTPPQRCRPSGPGAGQWPQERESVLFVSPANQPPPPPSPQVFSWCCSFHSSLLIVVAPIVTDAGWVHLALLPGLTQPCSLGSPGPTSSLTLLFPFHSNFIWTEQLQGWCPTLIIVPFGTGGLGTCSLRDEKSMKLSRGALGLNTQTMWTTSFSLHDQWLKAEQQRFNRYRSIGTIHQIINMHHNHGCMFMCRTVGGWWPSQLVSWLSLDQN